MAYVVSYASHHRRTALQCIYTASAASYCAFFDSVWIVPGTLTDE